MRSFWNICTWNFGKYQEKLLAGLFFNRIARLQSTACYRNKTPTTNTFLKLLRKERMFSNFKKIVENILFYRFKSRISDFNKNGIHAKYFLLVFWKVARKSYIIKPFNKVTGILLRLKKIPDVILFQQMFGKTALLKVLEHSQKNSSVENF